MEELHIQTSQDLPNNHLIFKFELHIEYEVATEQLLRLMDRARTRSLDPIDSIGQLLSITEGRNTLAEGIQYSKVTNF
jgi:hypothetical protein